MLLVLSHRILKKENRNELIDDTDIQKILTSFEKGVSTPIKGAALPHGSRLVKVYATSPKGARRIVYLVDVASGNGYFLMYRSKNDRVGQNISIKNPEFKQLLLSYLKILDEDLNAGSYDAYELGIKHGDTSRQH